MPCEPFNTIGDRKMAYQIDSDKGAHTEITTKMLALLNAATIATLHDTGAIRIGADRYLVYIVYE